MAWFDFCVFLNTFFLTYVCMYISLCFTHLHICIILRTRIIITVRSFWFGRSRIHFWLFNIIKSTIGLTIDQSIDWSWHCMYYWWWMVNINAGKFIVMCCCAITYLVVKNKCAIVESASMIYYPFDCILRFVWRLVGFCSCFCNLIFLDSLVDMICLQQRDSRFLLCYLLNS